MIRHDSRKNEWTSVAPMRTARCLFSLAVAHGFLYAIGGQAGKSTLNSVERYDPDSDTWEEVRSLNVSRSSTATAVHRNHIYVIGGATAYNSEETATVERFDGNLWTTVKLNMKTIFASASLFIFFVNRLQVSATLVTLSRRQFMRIALLSQAATKAMENIQMMRRSIILCPIHGKVSHR